MTHVQRIGFILSAGVLLSCGQSSPARTQGDGGSPQVGGTQGAGGVTSTGGVTSDGDATDTGGVTGAGGATGTGGTGGRTNTGGRTSTGGRTGAGGVTSTGGTTTSGGTPGTGGGAGSGGATSVACNTPRPSASLGSGFYVVGKNIYDRKCQQVLFRGINHTHYWGDQTNNLAAIPEIAKTHVNVVRAVFGPDSTSAFRQSVIEAYAASKIPVVMEDHRGTCDSDPSLVSGAVDSWIASASWLKTHEPHTIINITNEWGPDADYATWSAAYVAGIPRLRAAGLHHLILIDAGGDCGQNPRSILEQGQAILKADPEGNVAFSIHAYGYWRTPEATDVGTWNDDGSKDPWAFEAELTAVQAAGFAVIMGEVGYKNGSDGATEVLYQTKPALQILARLGIGWIAWSWNQNDPDTALDFIPNGGYRYNSASDLTPGGKLFVLDPDVGIETTAVATGAFD